MNWGMAFLQFILRPIFPYRPRLWPLPFCLSESFAFLVQNTAMSTPFMETVLGLSHEKATDLHYYKVLKDLSIFRRYAAKFLSEYEMFSNGDMADGNRYAQLMRQHTGFYYQPESHLFDLVPEFYCLDYVLAWIAEAMMETHLKDLLGPRWMLEQRSGDIMKAWWGQGNRNGLFQFLKDNGLGTLTTQNLLTRWQESLGRGI